MIPRLERYLQLSLDACLSLSCEVVLMFYLGCFRSVNLSNLCLGIYFLLFNNVLDIVLCLVTVWEESLPFI